jgi:nucleotide-binding universal stress UspA family protein
MSEHVASVLRAGAPPSRILLPVDFSAHSGDSRDYATALAREIGAEIHLLHAWNPLAWTLPNDELMLPEGRFPVICEAWQAILESWGEAVREEGVSCTVDLQAGPPSATIAQVAGEISADFIVMGTRGRSGLRHVLLGSVAERTMRLAPCPVVTLRQGVSLPPKIPFSTIVVGVDFSAAACRAVQFACDLGSCLGRPELVLVHAQPSAGGAAHRPGDGPVERQLREWADQLSDRGWVARTWLSHHPPAQAIVEIAAEEAADLVVVGRSASSAAAPEVLGRVTEQVVRTAVCATATVR